MLVRPQAEKDMFTAFVVARVRPRDADVSGWMFHVVFHVVSDAN